LPCVSYSENTLENAVIYVLDLTTGWRWEVTFMT
jgi:hypothetical protein